MVLGGKTSIVLKLYSYFSKEKEGLSSKAEVGILFLMQR